MADVTKKPPHEEIKSPKDDKKVDDPKAKKTEAEDLSEEDKQLQVGWLYGFN